MIFAAAMLVALVADALIGWPDALFRRIGHPVTWIGAQIGALDRGLNRDGDPDARRRAAGVLTVLIVTAAAALPALALQAALPGGWAQALLVGLLAWPLVAARSLHEHVAEVARPLAAGDLAGARRAVSMIVGRDPETLDAPAVARAGLESLAENASDGIVAPVFWGLLLGLPGIAAYKAINTMDSMIGHRTPRHEAFGWAAARLDDAVNILPARLTGLLFAAVSGRFGGAWRAMLRDAPRHRSPNAGWPEAAMAAGLGVRLSGPRVYGDRVAEEPWLNAGAPDPDGAAMWAGLDMYLKAMGLMAAALLGLALV
ncbi:adenosylcobinamide-phosphate synthase CbiB [Rhodovulum sp. DZ06]|uniref:adenosylcobinamide-phosphate synthase CbiB n=1 Tax=Rhodovulum sp. DZ06 TaxID=3425126 RepID=UPI003D3559E7